MKYIEKIILDNFQSHDHTELYLSRGVNVIVGPSDSGKTAIMRAIRWNLFNEPAGVEFVREGESEVSVSIRFQDRVEIIRRRSKSKNQYILRLPDQEEVVFEGFGTHVPQEIREATGIYKVMLDEKKALPLNFSDQLEGPFLLQETDAYKAQAIGRMVGVDVLDEAMRNTLRDKKQVTTRAEMCSWDVEKIENSLEEFEYLDEQIRKKQMLTDKLHQIKVLKDRQKKLIALQDEQSRINSEYLQTRELLATFRTVDRLGELLHRMETRLRHYREESHLFHTYRKNCEQSQATLALIRSLDNIKSTETLLLKLRPEYARYQALKPLSQKQEQLEDEKSELLERLKRFEHTDHIQPQRLNNLLKTLQVDRQLYEAYRELKQRIQLGHQFLGKFETVDQLGAYLERVNQCYLRLDALKQYYQSQETLQERVNRCAQGLENSRQKSKAALDHYLASLKEAGTCPFCKQTIGDGHIKRIRQTLEDEDELGTAH